MNHLNGKNEEDRRIYERSARLILLLALRDIAPGAKARFEHSIGLGLYLNVSGVSLTASLVRQNRGAHARDFQGRPADRQIPLDARAGGGVFPRAGAGGYRAPAGVSPVRLISTCIPATD